MVDRFPSKAREGGKEGNTADRVTFSLVDSEMSLVSIYSSNIRTYSRGNALARGAIYSLLPREYVLRMLGARLL